MAKNDQTNAAPIAPTGPAPSLEEVVRQMAQMQAQMVQQSQLFMQATEAQSRALAGIIADKDMQLTKERAALAAFEKLKSEAEKTCQQRTQEAADRKWAKAAHRYRCTLYWAGPGGSGRKPKIDRAWPVIDINANDADEAKARYQQICGITAISEGFVQAVSLDEPRASVGFDMDDPPPYLGDADERLPKGVEALTT